MASTVSFPEYILVRATGNSEFVSTEPSVESGVVLPTTLRLASESWFVDPIIVALRNKPNLSSLLIGSGRSIEEQLANAAHAAVGAIEHLETAVKHLASDIDHRLAAIQHLNAAQLSKLGAIEALLASPSDTAAAEFRTRGLHGYQRGLLAEAKSDFDQAIGANPYDYLSLLHRGHIGLLDNEPEVALEHYGRSTRTANAEGATFVIGHAMLGQARAVEDPDTAINLASGAIALLGDQGWQGNYELARLTQHSTELAADHLSRAMFVEREIVLAASIVELPDDLLGGAANHVGAFDRARELGAEMASLWFFQAPEGGSLEEQYQLNRSVYDKVRTKIEGQITDLRPGPTAYGTRTKLDAKLSRLDQLAADPVCFGGL